MTVSILTAGQRPKLLAATSAGRCLQDELDGRDHTRCFLRYHYRNLPLLNLLRMYRPFWREW